MYVRSIIYAFILDMSEILDIISILVFLLNNGSVLLLAFVKHEHCLAFVKHFVKFLLGIVLRTVFICTFWRLNTVPL